MKRKLAIAAIAAVTLTVLTACGSSGGEALTSNENGLTTLKIAAVQGGVMPVSFRAGLAEGIFEKHGLDVQVETVATGLDAISATVQGSADIGYSDIFGGTAARGNGFDIGLVTPFNGNAPSNYLVVPADSEIRSPSDLKGKNIAIGAPPLFKTLASIALTNSGVDPAEVTFTLVKDQTTFAALLKTGQVDAADITSVINGEKWIAEEGFRPVIDPNAAKQGIPLDTPVAGWWSTRAWFENNATSAQNFVDAITEVNTWYASLTVEQQAAYVKKQTGADPVALDRTYPGLLNKLTIDTFPPFAGAVDEEKLAAWLTKGQEYAAIPDIPLDDLLLPTARAK